MILCGFLTFSSQESSSGLWSVIGDKREVCDCVDLCPWLIFSFFLGFLFFLLFSFFPSNFIDVSHLSTGSIKEIPCLSMQEIYDLGAATSAFSKSTVNLLRREVSSHAVLGEKVLFLFLSIHFLGSFVHILIRILRKTPSTLLSLKLSCLSLRFKRKSLTTKWISKSTLVLFWTVTHYS